MAGEMPVVLCVDDEASIRSALRRVFLDEPWEIHFANGGEEGLAFIAANELDLVLSDFRMPGMDGVTFLKRAKELRPDCMRIVLSGYADINLIVGALNEGEIYRFLAKPWNDGELQHNIRKALEHHRLTRENDRLTDELRGFNAELEEKVAARTRELTEMNRILLFAKEILDVLPMPVLGIDESRVVIFANAKARSLLGPASLIGKTAPALFEPELSASIRRGSGGSPSTERCRVLPMVLDGEAVGAIILAGEEALLQLERENPRHALSWTVPPA